MQNQPMGFGIIGCGLVANWHADTIRSLDKATLVGATDINEEAGKNFADKYHILHFHSTEALLASPKVDVVCISTPSGLHAPIAVQAANAG